jgi:hypothetical protein
MNRLMQDGLYVVNYKDITAAFVIRSGRVTTCAPVLRKNIGFFKTIARRISTDLSIPPPGGGKLVDALPGLE